MKDVNPFEDDFKIVEAEVVDSPKKRAKRVDGAKGTLLDDPDAELGSLQLADPLKESYCMRRVTEPHTKPIDIYRDLYPDKSDNKLLYQFHNQYKNTKTVKTRLNYLKKKAFSRSTDAVDENYNQLITLRDKLYYQAHDAQGNIVDTQILDRYLRIVDTLNKMYGEYKHTEKKEIGITVNDVSRTRDNVENMIEEKLARFELR